MKPSKLKIDSSEVQKHIDHYERIVQCNCELLDRLDQADEEFSAVCDQLARATEMLNYWVIVQQSIEFGV